MQKKYDVPAIALKWLSLDEFDSFIFGFILFLKNAHTANGFIEFFFHSHLAISAGPLMRFSRIFPLSGMTALRYSFFSFLFCCECVNLNF